MSKRKIIIIAIALILVLASVFLCVQNYMMKQRLTFAKEQIHIFQTMEKQALQSSPEDAVDCMEYVINYYPSGTKHDAGTYIDNVVEDQRKMTVVNIISYLKEKTKTDIGDEPGKWIKKYKK